MLETLTFAKMKGGEGIKYHLCQFYDAVYQLNEMEIEISIDTLNIVASISALRLPLILILSSQDNFCNQHYLHTKPRIMRAIAKNNGINPT